VLNVVASRQIIYRVMQHLLIVDDEPAVRDLLTLFFHAHGYRTTTTANGLEGLNLLEEQRFHAAIIDLVFPEEDGLELLTEIKNMHPQLPVIVLTGVGYDDDLVREAVERRASGYISKGLPMPQLLMEVHRVLKPETLKL
jgi:DNA-binding NtrC family response regulator